MSKRPPKRRSNRSLRNSSEHDSYPANTPVKRITHLLDHLDQDLCDADPLQAELAASYASAEHFPQFWEATNRNVANIITPHIAVLDLLSHTQEARQLDAALTLAYALFHFDQVPNKEKQIPHPTIDKLRTLGAMPPDWAKLDPYVELTECLLLRDFFLDEITLFIGAKHPEFEAHTLALTLALTGVPELVEISVAGPLDEVRENVEASLKTEPNASEFLQVIETSPEEAAALVHDALLGTTLNGGEGLDAESIEYLSLAWARYEQLLHSLIIDWLNGSGTVDRESSWIDSDLDAMSDDELIESFISSEAFSSYANTSDSLATELTAWVRAEVDGGTARISPLVLEMYVGDLRASELEPTKAHLATLHAWIDFCCSKAPYPETAATVLHDVLDTICS